MAGRAPSPGIDEIAIFVLNNGQADLLEKCLKKKGFPYIVAEEDHFCRKKKHTGSDLLSSVIFINL